MSSAHFDLSSVLKNLIVSALLLLVNTPSDYWLWDLSLFPLINSHFDRQLRVFVFISFD
ncbi:hypothetical protein KIS1582_2364 [Cytobacillus firmus]|uniref:Uncharacterized protein n=1 Tax=Cytobacillus firmus TaxID=1399 RepID=A0A800MWM8_CYTFI|nr:hypothetical protein KIS1582_2364 [Cytobacillus firmus]